MRTTIRIIIAFIAISLVVESSAQFPFDGDNDTPTDNNNNDPFFVGTTAPTTHAPATPEFPFDPSGDNDTPTDGNNNDPFFPGTLAPATAEHPFGPSGDNDTPTDNDPSFFGTTAPTDDNHDDPFFVGTTAPTTSTATPTVSTAAPTASTASPTASTASPTASTAVPTASTATPTDDSPTDSPTDPTDSPCIDSPNIESIAARHGFSGITSCTDAVNFCSTSDETVSTTVTPASDNDEPTKDDDDFFSYGDSDTRTFSSIVDLYCCETCKYFRANQSAQSSAFRSYKDRICNQTQTFVPSKKKTGNITTYTNTCPVKACCQVFPSSGVSPPCVGSFVSQSAMNTAKWVWPKGASAMKASAPLESYGIFCAYNNTDLNISNSPDLHSLQDLYSKTGGNHTWKKCRNFGDLNHYSDWSECVQFTDSKRVTVLLLSDTGLIGELPISISEMTDLEQLLLGNNSLRGKVPSLTALHKLHTIDLSNNEFTEILSSLKTGIHFYQSILLQNNRFTDTFPEIASHSVECHLTRLNLMNNQFTGGFPISFHSCKNVHTIDISSNRFRYSISETLVTQEMEYAVQILNASYNNFDGRIPAALCKLPKLQGLHLEHNRFTQLPACIGASPNLVTLNLQNNLLSGTLPPKLLLVAASVDLSSNKLNGAFPKTQSIGPALRALSIRNNSFSGPFPSFNGNSKQYGLQQLDISLNDFSGSPPEYLCDLENLEILAFYQNRLSGNLPDCLFKSETLPKLTRLDMGCQFLQSSGTYHKKCPTPFNMPESGKGSMFELLLSTPTLARFDVTPMPKRNLVATTIGSPSIIPSYATTVKDVEIMTLMICGVGLAVILLLLWATSERGAGSLERADRFPQYGFMIDRVSGKMQDHDFVNRTNHASRTSLGGCFNVVKILTLFFFVIYSFAVFCLDGMKLNSATDIEKSTFISDGEIDFTISLSGAFNNTPVLVPGSVKDRWLQHRLQVTGHASHAHDIIREKETEFDYTFPVGWEPESNQRSITVLVNNTVLAEQGFQWKLHAETASEGEAPNKPNGGPSVSGVALGLPYGGSQCSSFSLSFCPIKDQGCDFSIHNNWYYNTGCKVHTESTSLIMSGRSGQSAVWGPHRFVCLSEATFYVEAVPKSQTVHLDYFASTSKYTGKTFELVLKGTETQVDENFASTGSWQDSENSEMCPNCVPAAQCPPVNVTFVIHKDLFLVSEVLQRETSFISFIPVLLASCMSLATIFLLVYNLIGAKASTRSTYIDWARAATIATKGFGGDKETAHALVLKRREHGRHGGCFSLYSDPEVKNTAILCVRDEASKINEVQEIRLELTSERTVLIHIPGIGYDLPQTDSDNMYRTSSLRSRKGSEGMRRLSSFGKYIKNSVNIAIAESREHATMQGALKSLALGKVPGAEHILLAKMLVPADLVKGMEGSLNDKKTHFSMHTNPAFDSDDFTWDVPTKKQTNEYLSIDGSSLSEPLLEAS